MAVALTGSESWGERMGCCAANYNEVDAFRGPQLDQMVSAIFSDCIDTDQIAVDNLYKDRDAYRQIHSQWLAVVQRIASNLTIEMVNRDVTLPTKNIISALTALIDQMEQAGQTIQRPTVSATPTPDGGNSGDAILIASAVDPYDGGAFDYALAEEFDVICTTDAAGGVPAFSEQVTFSGDPQRGAMEYNWPGGGGATALTVTATDGELNTLVTGSFESWSSGLPSGWSLVTGLSTISQSVVAPFRGSSNLRITSDGSTQTRLRAGPLTLSARAAYAVGVWAKASAGAAGSLVIKLVDAAGTTVNDENAVANSLAIDTATLTTSYAASTAFFRTPRVMPSAVYLDIHLATPPTGGTTLDIDSLAFVRATSLYVGGPVVFLFSGETQLSNGDRWTLAVTNSATSASFSRAVDRLFELRKQGLKFPSTTGSPTIPDSVVSLL